MKKSELREYLKKWAIREIERCNGFLDGGDTENASIAYGQAMSYRETLWELFKVDIANVSDFYKGVSNRYLDGYFERRAKSV